MQVWRHGHDWHHRSRPHRGPRLPAPGYRELAQLEGMMSEHTPEPWPENGHLKNRGKLFIVPTVPEGGVFEWLANRRRIVACVNACKGARTEDLEEVIA